MPKSSRTLTLEGAKLMLAAAERIAVTETRNAAKAHELTPAGEGSVVPEK
jgi:hypothetical protein